LKDILYIKFSDCQPYKKIGNSAVLLLDMFKEQADLNVWQSESNVLTNPATYSDTKYFHLREAESQVLCATGNKREYGLGSKCAVLWSNFGSNWTP
jgi:hypothetical protein